MCDFIYVCVRERERVADVVVHVLQWVRPALSSLQSSSFNVNIFVFKPPVRGRVTCSLVGVWANRAGGLDIQTDQSNSGDVGCVPKAPLTADRQKEGG